MNVTSRGLAILLLAVLASAGAAGAAEVIEEIVAKVNDDIITKSEFEAEEQALQSEIYRRFTGAELDEALARAREGLLQQMIDRKVLLHRAERLYDMVLFEDHVVRRFKSQQQIKSDQELEQLLAQEGMSLRDLKRRLVEMIAPEEVIRFEVVDRISVPDREVREYYDQHPDEWKQPAEVTLREIVLLAEGPRLDERRDEANAIRERAAEPGADFAALASELSEAGTRTLGGLLGPLNEGEVAPDLERLAFSLPVGAVSPVLETSYGFHIAKIEARTEARVVPFDEIREALRRRLENERIQHALDDFLEKARSEAQIEVSPKYQSRL
jgi:peptidyl-prolyl cis-trans isomerase SurA